MPSKRKYYWDANVFIAWLMAEKGRVELCDGIVSEVQKGQAIIITSAIIETEVLSKGPSQETQDKFRALLKRRDVIAVNVDRSISQKAGKLRERHKGLKGMDAIHLATAIIYGVDAFHTFEGDDGILKYDGNVAGYPLKICKPESAQKPFSFPGPATQI